MMIVRLAGVALRVKSGTRTISVASTLFVRLPLTPVMVRGYVPSGVAAVVVTVSVEALVVGFSEKLAVASAGSPLTLRATASAKPPVGLITTSKVVVEPGVMVRVDGTVPRMKSVSEPLRNRSRMLVVMRWMRASARLLPPGL